MVAGLQGAILLVAATKHLSAVLELNKPHLLMIADLQEILGRLDQASATWP
jgi:hypothetical protein